MGHYSESPKHEGLRYYFEEASRLDYDQAKGILSFERAARAVYRDAWKEADALYKVRRKQNPAHRWNMMKKENFVAIMCYTLEKPNICRHFNQLCRAAMPTKESWQSFPFKSLLYFLIKAFNLLPNFHAPEVFRGVDKFVHAKNEAQFVQFLSATVCPRQAAKFGRGVHLLVLRGIPAYLMKDISIYSIYPLHKEVLIWPFCVFTLTAGEDEAVKVLEFDREETRTREGLCGITWKSTVTALPESRTHLASATSSRLATAKIKSAERPAISGEQGDAEAACQDLIAAVEASGVCGELELHARSCRALLPWCVEKCGSGDDTGSRVDSCAQAKRSWNKLELGIGLRPTSTYIFESKPQQHDADSQHA
ncbi:hypothetical protein HPB49_020567 [Dermacentor silvarum]|uniref:Uncharacterized protein n=1 Tax=Dermacentor silvarum TaxID=543639 RepID=A0ACB8E2K0_DERSI|nr:hypothetical protein HPB49_020567 [Dermacentor silvarum]